MEIPPLLKAYSIHIDYEIYCFKFRSELKDYNAKGKLKAAGGSLMKTLVFYKYSKKEIREKRK